MIHLLMVLALAARLQFIAPTLSADSALLHAIAAKASATEQVPAELLLATAYIESKYDPRWVSRVHEDGRRIGLWRSSRPVGNGPRFCGVMQTKARHSWTLCLVQRDVFIGYATGAAELEDWMRIARGDLRGALRGHGCGVAGMRGECHNRYELHVLAVARRLGWTPPRRPTT